MKYKQDGKSMTYLEKWGEDERSSLSTQIGLHYDQAQTNQSDKGLIWRDSMNAYHAVIPSHAGDTRCGEDVQRGFVVDIVRQSINGLMSSVSNTLIDNQNESFVFTNRLQELPPEVEQAVTDKVNDTIMNKNDGAKLKAQVYKESITTGDGYTKKSIQTKTEKVKGTLGFVDEVTGEFNNKPQPLLQAILTTEEGEELSLLQALQDYPESSLQDKGLKFRKGRNRILLEGVDEDDLPDSEMIPFNFTQRSDGVEVEYTEVKVSGEINLYRTTEEVVEEFVPLKDIFIDRFLESTDLEDADYICHRIKSPRYKIHEMFEDSDEESLDRVKPIDQSSEDDLSARLMNIQRVVTNSDEQTGTVSVDGEDKSMLDICYVYEHYITYQCPETKAFTKMCVKSATEHGLGIFDIQKIDGCPFFHYCPFPTNTSHFGESGALHLLYPYQLEISLNEREFQRNIKHASNNRMIALKGQYDRRSLIDNRVNGVVEVNSLGALTPYPYHQLNPAVMQYQAEKKETLRGEWSSMLGTELLNNANDMTATATQTVVGQFNMKDKEVCKRLAYTDVKGANYTLKLLAEMGETITVKRNYTDEELREAQQRQEILEPEVTIPLSEVIKGGDFVANVMTSTDRAQQVASLLNTTRLIGTANPKALTPESIEKVSTFSLKVAGLNYDDFFPSAEDQPSLSEPEIQQLQQQVSEQQTALTKANYDKVVAETRKIEVGIAAEVEENKRETIDQHHQHNLDKFKAAQEDKEFKAKVVGGAWDRLVDWQINQFHMDRATAEAQATMILGQDVKFGSHQNP